MKMITKIGALLAVAVFMVGCFDDKSTVGDRDINELQIEVTFNTSYGVIDGELLEIKPKLLFKNGTGNTERLQYKWTLDGETYPGWNQLNFSWVAKGVHYQRLLRLEVFDPVTGITYIAGDYLTIVSRYDKAGLHILAEKDGVTQFSYLRFTETDITDEGFAKISKIDPYINIYTQENGADLPAGPVMIMEHFCSDIGSQGQMFVATKGGAVDVSSLDYKKEVDLQQVFEKGAYPKDFGYVSDAFSMRRVDLVADAQGHIYTRIKPTSKLFQAGEYIDQRLIVEDEEVKGCRFLPAPFDQMRACMVYDSNKKRLFLINDTGSAGDEDDALVHAGHPYVLSEPVNPPVGFVPINDMRGITPIWMGYYRSSAWYALGYIIVFEREGKIFCQQFDLTREYGQCKYAIENPVITEITGLPGIPTCAYAMPYGENPTVLLAVGNELWLYDRGNPNLPVTKYSLELSSPVVAMHAENYYSRILALALEDGTVYLVNAVRMSNPATKEIFYKSKESFGKVRHIGFKVRAGDGWSFQDDDD